MKVALVSCARLPEPDPDLEPLCAALAAAGLAASVLAWDDPRARPAEHALCVLRSTWDYHLDPPRFLDWVARTARATRLLNPEPVVRWNAHKGYLLELEARGLAVVPTRVVRRGEACALDALAAERGWGELVVKPAVSGGSWRTRRFAPERRAEAQAFLDELARERDALVQPCLRAFEEPGERALVWIDGRVTHAVRKRPRFAGESEAVELVRPEPVELDCAARALAPLAGELLYARVDLVLGPDGAPLLSELELIEPSLFLLEHPPALAALVEAIRDRLP